MTCNPSSVTSHWVVRSAAVVLIAASAHADFTIPWWTIDAGGELRTTGGEFELSGTIGQPDANGIVITSGGFALTGGFWALPAPSAGLVGDLNCDGDVGFGDINAFVLRLSNPAGYFATYPACPDANGDINGDGEVGFGDINPFVMLLSGE